jgi:hypothetical protein
MSPVKIPLSVSQILALADDYRRHADSWLHSRSGPVQANPAETWGGINQALNVGGRGLSGGDSLGRLLARARGRGIRCESAAALCHWWGVSGASSGAGERRWG